ncbi:MAG: LysE family transporter [Paramuribaculum sp.]|nr:LysE family transporter [Paramuribaculum sp.]
MEDLLKLIFGGLAIGLCISAPMGPTGALVVRRAINNGRLSALLTGVGAAFSDIIYTYLTIYFSYLAAVYIYPNRVVISLVSSVILVLYGIYLFRSNPSRNIVPKTSGKNTYWKDFVSGFLFTFANPLIIIFIITLMGTLTFLPPEPQLHHTIIGLAAVAFGALLWWYCLTYFIHRIRSHFNVRSIWLINRGIAIFILFLAIFGFWKGISYLDDATPDSEQNSIVIESEEQLN